jgi:hypothetical protein
MFAALACLGYAAMRLRTGSLWPPVILHARYDLTFRVAAAGPGSMFVNLVPLLHGVGWAVRGLGGLRGGRAALAPARTVGRRSRKQELTALQALRCRSEGS